MTTKLHKGECLIEVFNGPEGPTLCIGDDGSSYRLVGPKLIGQRPVFRFRVKVDELKREIASLEACDDSQY